MIMTNFSHMKLCYNGLWQAIIMAANYALSVYDEKCYAFQ
jgi:hypothetical protein